MLVVLTGAVSMMVIWVDLIILLYSRKNNIPVAKQYTIRGIKYRIKRKSYISKHKIIIGEIFMNSIYGYYIEIIDADPIEDRIYYRINIEMSKKILPKLPQFRHAIDIVDIYRDRSMFQCYFDTEYTKANFNLVDEC